MLTLDALREYGADVDEGLMRCMNNEAFYLRLVKMAVADNDMEALGQALQAGDLGRAFECAHSLKGVAANLSLTPIYGPVSEMTELLRSRSEADYSGLYDKAAAALKDLTALCAE